MYSPVGPVQKLYQRVSGLYNEILDIAGGLEGILGRTPGFALPDGTFISSYDLKVSPYVFKGRTNIRVRRRTGNAKGRHKNKRQKKWINKTKKDKIGEKPQRERRMPAYLLIDEE